MAQEVWVSQDLEVEGVGGVREGGHNESNDACRKSPVN